MDVHIETPRLLIREILPADDKGMFALDSDADVHRYLGNRLVKTVEESRRVIEILRQQYQQLGIGRWAMLDRDTHEFMGWIGFKRMLEPVNKHSMHLDFGYRLRKEFWRRGYATEGSLACLDYGINTLHFKDIYAMTHIDNAASRRVLEKVGFTLEEIFAWDAAEPAWREPGAPTTWYAYNSK